MEYKKWRNIALLPPIKKNMKYYLTSNNETTRETVSFDSLSEGILEQIRVCVDEKGGLCPKDKIEIYVKVKYRRN